MPFRFDDLSRGELIYLLRRAEAAGFVPDAPSAARVSDADQRLRLVMEASNEGLWEWNIRTGEVSWSDRTCEMLGMRREQFGGDFDFIRSLLHPEDLPRMIEALRRHWEEGVPYRIDLRLRRADGTYRTFHARGTALRDTEGRVTHMAGSLADVEPERRRERLMEETQALARIGGWELDLVTGEGFWTAETYRLFGVTPETFRPTRESVARFLTPEAHARTLELLRDSAETGGPWQAEGDIVTADGQPRRIVASGRASRENGKVIRLHGAIRDITEEHRAREAMRRAEQRHTDFIGTLDGIFWEADARTFAFTFVSRQAERVLGYPLADWLIPDFWKNRIHPEDRERAVSYCATETALGKGHVFEYRMIAADGRVIWLRDIVSVTVRDGKASLLRGVMVDITELKTAEAALRRSEGRFRAIFNSAFQFVGLLRPDGTMVEANDTALRAVGARRSEVVGRPFWETPWWAHSPELQARLRDAVERASKGRTVRFEADHVLKDGAAITVDFSLKPVRDENGEVILLLPEGRDITERKAAERALAASEEKYATVFRNSPDAITLTRLEDGQVIETNDGFERIFGIPAAEALGRTTTELGVWADLADRDRVVRHLLSEGPVSNWELPFRRRDGREGVAIFSAERIEIRGEKCLVTVVRDITERRRVEDAMRFSEERYRMLVENSSDLVAEVTADARFLYVSPTFQTRLGYAPEELIDNGIFAHVHPDDVPRAATKFMLAEASDVFRFRHRDGSWRWLEAHGREYRTSGGEVRAVIIARDITERRLADEARANLESQLRQAQKLEAIGTLAGGVAHDFNNILAAILAYVELARMDLAADSPALEHLDQVAHAGERATHLVRQILAFSRKQKNERHVLRLDHVVAESLRMLRSTLPATIEISRNLRPDTGHVLADPTQIHQVVINLCTNAAHALRDRTGRIDVALEPFEMGGHLSHSLPELRPGPHVRLTVRDNGLGMSEETLKRVFEPFYTTKPPGEGTGLGLAVVHGIVKDHDGAIRVSSETGVGSVFEVWLPAQAEPPANAPASAPPAAGSGQRVLFVDDETALCLSAEKILRRLGFTVLALNDPEQALATFKAEPAAFDVLVSDLTMPGMTGIDLATRVLTLRPDMPVILVTGFSGTWTPEKLRELGIRDLVHKPATPAALAAAIQRATG